MRKSVRLLQVFCVVLVLLCAPQALQAATVVVSGSKNLSDLLNEQPDLGLDDISLTTGGALTIDVPWATAGRLNIDKGSLGIAAGSVLTVNGQIGTGRGGVLYANDTYSSTPISIGGTGMLLLNGNSVTSADLAAGAGVYGSRDITFGGSVIMNANTAASSAFNAAGAAVSGSGNVTFNGAAVLAGNLTQAGTNNNAYGGAVYGGSGVSFKSTALFSGNTASGLGYPALSAHAYGGAVHALALTFAKEAVFTGNQAKVDYGYAEGGALYGSSATFFADSFFVGNTAVSSNHRAYGGAVAGTSSGASFNGLTVLAGNSANAGSGDAFGGAVYAKGGASFNRNSVLVGNTAITTDAHAWGGAVYSEKSTHFGEASARYATVLSGNVAQGKDALGGAVNAFQGLQFTGAVTISGNSAITVSADGDYTDKARGGALYVVGDLSLETGTYDSTLIAGNRVRRFGAPVQTTANFVNFSSGKNMSVKADGIVDMRDPVGVSITAEISAKKTGSGVWLLGGENSFGHGNFTVEAGTLHLYRAGQVSNGVNGDVARGAIDSGTGIFTLKSGATLSVGGDNRIKAGTITFEQGSTLAFDLAHHDVVPTTPMLELAAGTLFTTPDTVDILSLPKTAGTYFLIKDGNFSFDPALTLRGENVANTRIAGQVYTWLQGNDLKVTTNADLSSQILSWTGSSGDTWNATATGKWKEGVNTPTRFLHGDVVSFAGGTGDTVTVNAGGVAVGGMSVAGEFAFVSAPGGRDSGIVIDSRLSSITDPDVATGRLDISPGASVDFTGITGVNRFENGIKFFGNGDLHLGKAAHLGTEFKNVVFNGNANLYFGKPTGASSQTYAFTGHSEGGDDANRIKGTEGSLWSLVLHADSGVTVTFANLKAPLGASGGAVYSDNLLDLEGHGAFLFAGNSADGAGADGGALYAANSLAMETANTVFAGNMASSKGGALATGNELLFEGKNAFFGGNSAGDDGGAVYITAASTFAGANAVFSGNSAGRYGGAIASGAALTYSGADAVFAGNSASKWGGALYSNGDLTYGGANALFAGNSASATGTSAALGGALFAQDAALTFSGANSIFAGNSVSAESTSAARGGALHAAIAGVDFSGVNAVFAGNNAGTIAGNAEGGAVYGAGAVTFSGAGAVFSGNSVISTSGGASGGAIFTGGDASVTGGLYFTGNSASSDSGTARGGAIFASGNLSLRATGADMLFAGNTAGGAANALHMGTTSKKLALCADSGKAIRFYDGITNTGTITVRINENAADTGTVLFSGAGGTSPLTAFTMVGYGTLALEKGAAYGVKAGSSFTLGAAATLKTDVKGNAVNANAITLEDGSTLAFDLTGAVKQGTGATTNLKVDTGVVTVGGTTPVRVYVPPTAPGKYQLIDSTVAVSGTGFGLYMGSAGTAYTAERKAAGGAMYGLASGNESKQLLLNVVDAAANSSKLVWNTGAGTWKHTPLGKTDTNWQGFVQGIAVTTYLNGDDVFFEQTGGPRSITVDSAGVSPASMTLNNSVYNFSGGAINVTGAVSLAAGIGLEANASRPSLTAQSVTFGAGSALNITGYTPGATPNPYNGGPANDITVIRATSSLSALPATLTVSGQPTVDFMTASARKDGNSVKVAAGLSWYSTDANRQAHGDFTIAAGQNFTLGAILADNTVNNSPPWDGKTLTKNGAGTLTLTAANTYTGGTVIDAGTLALAGAGAIEDSSGVLFTAAGSFDISAAAPASGAVEIGTLAGPAGSRVVLGKNTLSVGHNGGAGGFVGVISGEGGVEKVGLGSLVLSGKNTYSGITDVMAGVLSANAAGSFSAKSVHSIRSGGTLNLNGYDQSIAGLEGSGKVKLGAKTLAIRNTDLFGSPVFTGSLEGSGEFRVEQGWQTLQDPYLSAMSGSFAVMDGAGLDIISSGALTVNKALKGGGMLSLAATGAGTAVSLGAGAGNAFTGIVNLLEGTMELDPNAGTSLAGATLMLAESTGRAKVSANRNIGAMSLLGGNLMFDAIPATQWAPAGLLGVSDLEVQGGTVMLQALPTGGVISDMNFFDYAHVVGEQLVLANGAVVWDGTALALTDYTGKEAEAVDVSPILQNGVVTGNSYFGHMPKVSEGGTDKGISIIYSLAKIEALAGKSVILDSSDAQNANPRLVAKLTGAGGFAFTGSKAVIVANSANNYTGPTNIASTVTAGSNNALGQTSNLSLEAGGRFNLADRSQTVQALTGKGLVNLGVSGAGKLAVKLEGKSVYKGRIEGSGTLAKSGRGTFVLGGTVGEQVHTRVTAGGFTLSGTMEGPLTASSATVTIRGEMNGPSTLSNSVTRVRGSLMGLSSLVGGRMDIFDGGKAGQVTVGRRASLGFAGSARAGAVTVRSGGTLEAGRGGSTAALIMDKGSKLKAMNGNSPLTVTGAALFSMGKGDIRAVLDDAEWKEGKRYALLQAPKAGAADLKKLFDGQEISHMLYTGLLGVSKGLLYLDIEGSGNFDGLGLTPNEQHALEASMTLPRGNPVRDAVWRMASTGSRRDLARAGDQLSGEVHADLLGSTALLARAYAPYLLGRISAQSMTANRTRLAAMPSLFASAGSVMRAKNEQGGAAAPGEGFIDASARGETPADANFATASGGMGLPGGAQGYEATPDGYSFRDHLGRSNSLWVSVGGSYTYFDGTSGVAESKLYGPEVSGGYDIRTDQGWLAGLGFRYGFKKFDVDGRDDNADINSYTVSLYGGKEWNAGPGILRTLLGTAYTLHNLDTDRQVRLPTFRDSLEADYNAHSFQVFAEAAYAVKALDALTLEPYLSFSWDRTHTESFTESGGAARLHVRGKTRDNYSTWLGTRFHVEAGERLDLTADFGWVHTFGGTSPKDRMRFAEGGERFSIRGSSVSRNAASVGLAADIRLTDDISLNIGYKGLYGGRDTSHGGSATFTLRW